MKPAKLLRCAIYTRKSTEEGLEQAFNSLHAQREACEAYIKSQAGEGWVALPTVYDDGGFSGGNMERPALKALLADIDRGLVDVVVVYKVDRLTRALADFAKIVERFDKQGVSFVSVTQAFNTTSSMGRLTLNVLLSFAQFEREVTSERIRDKLAASKKKGMWMGGRRPFGYAVVEKKLVPDETEAPIVQRIFKRYLQLKSVHRLKAELEAEGVVTKTWVSRHGRSGGGTPFDRGALYHLLQNRLYVGEIAHKTARYKGEHKPIVPEKLFEAVSEHLASLRRRGPGVTLVSRRHPLVGLLWDDAGNRMTPTHGQKNGRKYRYYVSRASISCDHGTAGSVPRIAADTIENLVLDRVRRLACAAASTGIDTHSLLRAVIERVEVSDTHVLLGLSASQLQIKIEEICAPRRADDLNIADLQSRMPIEDEITQAGDVLRVRIAACLRRQGQFARKSCPVDASQGDTPGPDPALLKAIARAHGWLNMLLSVEASTLREIAELEGLKEPYVRKILPLAFLPPDELRDALSGRQSVTCTVDALARTGVPIDWKAG